MDPEEQFYPFISLAICGNEDPYFIQCFRIISFHEESSTPPPLSKIWDIQFNPLKNSLYFF